MVAQVHPPMVRAAALGEDRDGRRAYRLQAGPVLAGEREGWGRGH